MRRLRFADVGDLDASRFAAGGPGPVHRILIGAVDHHDFCALGLDRLAPLRQRTRREVDAAGESAPACHARDRTAVVSGTRRDERAGAGIDRALGRPRRAEDLEGRQTEPRRLILEEDPVAQIAHGCRRVAGERAVEGVYTLRVHPS